MNKKKINIIDLLVVLLILILIFAAVMKFRNYNVTGDDNAKIDNFKYDIKISNIRNYTLDAYLIGDMVYDAQTNMEIGKIVDKSYSASKEYVKINTGVLVEAEIPERYDMILTIETDGTINETGYFANRSVELKVGSEKTIETLYAKSTGIIVGISENEIAE